MRKVAIIFLIVLLFSPALADIENPKLLKSIHATVRIEGNLSGEGAKNLQLRLFEFPREEENVEIISVSSQPPASYDEEAYSFSWSRPDFESYSLQTELSSNYFLKEIRSEIAFPFQAPAYLNEYLEATDIIDSNNPIIKSTANDLARGKTDAYEVIFALANFTHNAIQYDLSYSGKKENATFILQEGKGVCVAYQVLFMALARSLGIPARTVNGVAYGNIYEERFGPHSWVEVWLPNYGWVPVDPTFGEIGWIDASHIPTQFSSEAYPPSIAYSWKGGSVESDPPNITVKLHSAAEGLPNYLNTSISVEHEEIGFGSYNLVKLWVKNNMPFYISSEAYLTKAPEIIGENQKLFFLKPFGSKELIWVIKVPENLSSEYEYIYTVEANVLFGGHTDADFIVKPRGPVYSKIEKTTNETKLKGTPHLELYWDFPSKVQEGKAYSIKVIALNSGTAPMDRLKVCFNNSCQEKFVGIGSKEEFSITDIAEGKNEFWNISIYFNSEITNKKINIRVEKNSLISVILKIINQILNYLNYG